MDDFHEKMERIVYTNEHSDREDYLKALMATITDKLLAKLHTEVDFINLTLRPKKLVPRLKMNILTVSKMISKPITLV